MEGKKKYIVLLIFLLIGLSVFTFANPGENEEELNGSENGSKEVKKDNESDKTDNTIVVDETENDEENSKSNRNSTVGNSNNNKGNQTDKKQDNTYQDALRAVEIAENSLNKEDSSKARTLVDRVTDETKKQELASRLDAVDAAINATELIAALEEMVNNATNKDDMDSTRDFRDTNSIQDVISALTTEDVKQSLQDRLDDVNIILNDTTPALIMGIEDGQITNEDVTLTVNEENVTIKVTLNGQEIDPLATFTEEGEYVYTVLDQAFNESSVTFTIDKTAAKKNAVNANVNGYKNEVKTQYAINGKTITAYISINEELKNNPTFIFFANGKEIARVANENVVASTSQNNDYPYVYTAVLEINENLVAEDGNITFHVVDILDKAGNKTDDITKMSVGEKVIILDRTENRVTQTFFRKGNSVEVGKTYYIKNGGKVQFNIGFREELGEDAVVTIGGKEVKLTFENYFAATNSYMYYGYLEIPENETELTEGQLEIVISNVTDKAGNTGFYYQTNGKKVYETFTTNVTTNGKAVIYDRTPAARVYSTLRVNKTEYIENGVKYYYVKNGDSFEFAISFTEELTTAPTVTIAGREVEMVLNEKVKNNENKFLYEGTFTIDANEKDLKQGTLEIKVSNIKDIALNETVLEDQTVTSNGRSVVYDNRNPVIEGINNKYHYKTPVTINEVKNNIHNVSPIASATIDGEKYELGTEYDKEGTHEFVAYDRAGNRVRVTFTIDYTAPAITGVDETKATNKNEIVYVSDKNLDKVVIDGTEYTASDFTTVDGLIKFQKKITHEGTHTVVAYDKAGNDSTVTFVIDKTAPEYATLRMLGGRALKENGVQTWYVKAGETINVYMTFKEKLATNAKVKLNGEELSTSYIKEVDGTYMYGATYKVTENSKQGAVSIEVYGYADEAGNEGVILTNDDITTPGQKNVSIDTIAPEYATLRMLGGRALKENGVQTWYVKAGETINVYMTFKEKLATNAKVKLNGEELSTSYIKEIDGTYMYGATYTVTKNSKQGAVSIEVYGYADKVGNVGAPLTNDNVTTPGQKNVSIDTIAPEYATLRMLGGRALKENGVQTWYVKAGETINVYMTFKEKLATNAKVKLNGEELSTSYIKEVDGTYMYGATYKVTENSKQGAVSIEVYGYADKVGNVGVTLTNDDITTPGQKNVSIDTIAPIHSSIRMLGGKGYWENGKYTMYTTNGTTIYVYTTFTEKLATNPTVTLNEKVSKLAYLAKISDDSYIYAAEFKLDENDGLKDGDVSVKVVGYADKVGNVGVKLTNDDIKLDSQKYIVIDKTAPELEIDYRPELADKRTDVVGSDTNKIVIKVYRGTEVVKTVDEKSNYKRFSIDWLGDGEYKVVVTDQAGNSTEAMATIDHTAPVVTPSYTEKTVEGDKTKEFTDFPTFEITDLTEVTTKLESGSVDMSKVGTYTLSYSFTDKFNNVTTKDITINVVDTTSPVVTANAKNNVHVEYVTGTYTELGAIVTDNIDADYEKSAPSYINLYELGENNATGPFVRRLAEGETVDPNVIGKYLLVYMAEDAEGNVSNNQLPQSKIWVIVSDTTAPKLSKDFREDTLEKKTDIIATDLQDITLYAYRDGELVKTYPGGKRIRTNFDWFGNGNYRVVARDLSGNESEITYTLGKNTLKPVNGTMSLTGNMTLWNDSLYYDETGNGTKGDIINASGDVVINGNGYTVTQIATEKDAYMEWPTGYKPPAMTNIFASKNGSFTVNNLTLVGETTSNTLGYYSHPTKKNYLNNVTMKNLEVVSFSQVAAGLLVYGEAEINNSIITGTKMSSKDESGFPLYDMVLFNDVNLVMNSGKVGTVYVWNKAKATFNNVKIDTIETATRTNVKGHVTIGDGTTVNKITAKAILIGGTDLTKRYNAINIKSGAKVKVLDLSEVDLINEVVIEDGAIVEKIITKFGELTQEEFKDLLSTPEGKLKLAFLQGGTYKLTEDTTLTEEVELASNKTLVIDLDGKELVIDNPDDDSSRLIKNKGNLTIKDGDLVNQDTHSYGIVSNEGTLTIDNVDVKDNGSKDGSTFNNNGTLIIKDSTISITSISSAINGKTQKWGDAAVSNTGTLEIKDTTITADSQSSYAIRMSAGNASLDNVNITNTKGAFGITGGTANIKNSNFETHKYYTIYAESSNNVSVTVDGGKYNSARAAIYLANASAAKDVSVLVKGGTFISKNANYEVIHTDAAQADQTFDVIIKGGKFTGALNDVTAYLADGYEQNISGEVVEKL